eukprot:540474_1
MATDFVDDNQFQNSALLLVDFQQAWTQDANMLNWFPNLQQNVHKLVSFARDKKMEIIHVYEDLKHNVYPWTEYYFKLLKSTDYNRFNLDVNKPDLNYSNPLKNEKIVIKPHFNGFYKTELDEYLKSKNIKSVYIAGLVTSICVLNTANGALHHGYDTYIVEDCCGDKTKVLHDVILEVYFTYGVIKCVKIGNDLKRTKEMIPSKL